MKDRMTEGSSGVAVKTYPLTSKVPLWNEVCVCVCVCVREIISWDHLYNNLKIYPLLGIYRELGTFSFNLI